MEAIKTKHLNDPANCAVADDCPKKKKYAEFINFAFCAKRGHVLSGLLQRADFAFDFSTTSELISQNKSGRNEKRVSYEVSTLAPPVKSFIIVPRNK